MPIKFVKSGWSYNDARKNEMVYSVAELGLPYPISAKIYHFAKAESFQIYQEWTQLNNTFKM